MRWLLFILRRVLVRWMGREFVLLFFAGLPFAVPVLSQSRYMEDDRRKWCGMEKRRCAVKSGTPLSSLLEKWRRYYCQWWRATFTDCFMLEFFKKAKEKRNHTTIDTAGGPFTREEPFFSKFQELMKYTDLLLVDIKHIDNKYHKVLTGRSNENILDMIRYLS